MSLNYGLGTMTTTTYNNVIVEDTDQLSNLRGIVRDPTGCSMHWLTDRVNATSEGYNQTVRIGLSDPLLVAIATSITKTRLCNFDPLKPHFYIVKLGFTGVYIIFLISAKKHRLWVLVRTASARRF